MPANVAEWDARYRQSASNTTADPASIVCEWLPLLPDGPALDLACGTGRHTILLGARRASVTAIDWSAASLDILENRAREGKLPVDRIDALEFGGIAQRSAGGVRLMEANLEKIRLPNDSFSVILCLQYLQRSLFRQVAQALRPGGLLLFETFTQAQLKYSGGPRNPSYLLGLGELRTAFPELHVLFYRELNAGQGIASLVARKPALDSE
ncbi:MAG: class I SAM-dependent methyltransferase [Candidatus Acidiferrum sp.]